MTFSNRLFSYNTREQLATNLSPHINVEAYSTKKNIGYKGHIGVGISGKFILQVVFFEIFIYNSVVLNGLISKDKQSHGDDKIYNRKLFQHIVCEKGWYNRILAKTGRDETPSRFHKKHNKRQLRIRSQLKHSLAAINGRYKICRTKEKTNLHNKFRFLMAAICTHTEYNILGAKNERGICSAAITS